MGTVQNGTDKLKLYFDYGSTTNNGNVQNQTITVPGLAQPFIQSYAYDSLNRLASAIETNNGSQTWKQEFSYDRYGNRNFVTGTGHTTQPTTFDATTNPSFDVTKNRFSLGQGYSYDNAGNTLTDAAGKTYTYDGENKHQVNSGSTVLGQYWYDGDGKRVKKTGTAPNGQAEVTIFVYDAAGKQIAEYSTIVEGSSTAKVNYLTSEHLGSPRINTDANGAIIARHDYNPFGEEIDGAGGRTTGLNYGSDGVRKQFTGYERDNESGLDFAQARYSNFNLGRFLSPDPQKIVVDVQLEKDQDKGQRLLRNYLNQPSQWNRYVYAVNNPIKYTDPDGREIRLSSVLTEAERNQILYYLSRNTRDQLNWKTDKNGNIVVTVTERKNGGENEGTRLIRRLSKYGSVITIQLGTGGNGTDVDNAGNASNGVGSNSTITFNPNSNPSITTLDPKTGNGLEQVRPSHIGLAHELIHADHIARGTLLTGTASYLYRDSSGNAQAQSYRREEFATVGLGGLNNRMDITENNIRREQGLNLRAAY